jgi:hypothetical protein
MCVVIAGRRLNQPIAWARAQKGIFSFYSFRHPGFMITTQICFSLLFLIGFRAAGIIHFDIDRKHVPGDARLFSRHRGSESLEATLNRALLNGATRPAAVLQGAWR